ncbi:hypothetical protein [Corynebacterium aurimucosum]|nr:hypothetical protein [Corynebacterium aurimucosum]MBE7338108.1 hypothetical protein [Corynebacterium aurimucosum]
MNEELRQRAETEIVTAILDYNEDPHHRAEEYAADALDRILTLTQGVLEP